MTTTSQTSKTKKVKKNFTAEVVANYQCEAGKSQSIYWDAKTTGLGFRVTSAGARSYIFETSLNGKTIRMTIGDVGHYSIAKARDEAISLKAMTNKGIDPRLVKADQIASDKAKAQAKKDKSIAEALQTKMESVTMGMALNLIDVFTEVLIAPGYELEALRLLIDRKKNLRILELPKNYSRETHELRQISGGLLVQEADSFLNFSTTNWKLVSGAKPDEKTMADLAFAWRAVRAVKSNAILLAKDGSSIGIGMGQVNRVDSCKLAVTRGDLRVNGSVAASDAFFPFADGLEVLINAGVKAVVQPGGSVKDEEVIAAAKEAKLTMFFTGERHFYH